MLYRVFLGGINILCSKHGNNTFHWTDFLALRDIEMADAFSAFVGVDDIEQVTGGDGIVGAFWFTDIAVDAFISDFKRHERPFESKPKLGQG